MADHYINIALINYSGPYYLTNTTNVNLYDEVEIKVFWGTGETYVASCLGLAGSPYNMGASAMNQRSGSGAGGAANPAVFAFNVAGAGGTEQNLDFYGSIYNSSTGQYEITSFPDSARVKLVITDPNVCNYAGPSGTLSVSSAAATEDETTTVTLSGLSADTNCLIEYRKVLGSTYYNWQDSTTMSVQRGSTYTFQAQYKASTLTRTIVSSAATYIPYLPLDTNISLVSTSINSTDGTWTAQLVASSITPHGAHRYAPYRFTNEDGIQAWRAIYNGVNQLQLVQAFHNETTMTNTWVPNTPEDQTTTYQIWGIRDFGQGGWPFWAYTGRNFDVTYGAVHGETVSDPSGTYFDNYEESGAQHSVTLANTSPSWYYSVMDSSGNVLTSWTTGNGTRIITDTNATTPAGTGATSTTYTVLRDETGDAAGAENTGVTYVRALVNYARFTMSDISIGGTGTTVTHTIGNTIDGHTYYIFRGEELLNPEGDIASGTSTSISVTESSIPNAGNTATHTLKTQSPYNSSPSSEYTTGVTCTITRTGEGEAPPPPASSGYGMEVYATNGIDKLYDTTSRSGRIMASGRAPTIGTIDHGEDVDVTVAGLTNSTDYNIVVIPDVGGTGTGLGAYAGYIFDITKTSGEFTIENQGGIANAYNYYVLKSGGE